MTAAALNASKSQIFVGQAGADNFTGGNLSDVVLAGAGDDTLDGGTGNDKLYGGSGTDSYKFSSGSGQDTILDSDGQGLIMVGSTLLSGGKQTSAGSRIWQSADGQYRYSLTDESDSSQSLSIFTVGGSDRVVVKNFQNGRLGITLDNVPAPVSNIYYGTENDDRPVQGIGDFSLRGSADADDIRGLAGVDHLYGLGGSDALNGGGGSDLIYGGADDDIIEGGLDDDDLVGESGNDVLSGGAGVDYLSGDLFGMGLGSGNDYLDGGSGNDTLMAGGGNDVLFGGDGDDFLNGDADSTPSEYHGSDFLDGGAGNDTLFGSGGSDVLLGGAGNDILYGDANVGTPGDDQLEGGVGNDTLYGNAGNDHLSGGTGIDELSAGPGSDTYHYALGDGADTLFDVVNAGDVNTLSLERGITLANTKLSFDAQGYKLKFGDGGSLSLKGNYSYSLSGGVYSVTNAATNSDIQGVTFSDGVSLSWLQMVQRGFAQSSTVVGAVVSGTNYNDTLSGAQNATLQGGLGSDTYVVQTGGGLTHIVDPRNAGDVNTLQFGAGITAASITLGFGPGVLKLHLGGAGDVQIQGFDPKDAFNSVAVDQFEFEDGTVFTVAQLLERGFEVDGSANNDILLGTNAVDHINALAGDDVLVGGAGADVLDGGVDNDDLQGGAGNDTYVFRRGGGSDRVFDEDGSAGNVDTVLMDAGIAASDVHVTRDLSTLYLSVRNAGGATDRMALQRWFDADDYRVEQVRFADDTVWDAATLSAMASIPSEDDNSLVGSDGAEDIEALGGDDALIGLQGNDTLQGGAGNDSYYFNLGDGQDEVIDSSGSDTLVFGAGVTLANLKLESAAGSDLRKGYGGGDDSVLIRGGLNNSIERIALQGQGSYSVEQLLAQAGGVQGIRAMPSVPGVGGPMQYVDSQAGVADALIGYATDTTFRYRPGDGWDTIMDFGGVNTIEFGPGIAPESLTVLFDYLPRNALTGEYDPQYHLLIDEDAAISVIGDIQYFRFADGTVFDFDYLFENRQAQIANDPGGEPYRAPVLLGSAGNNQIDIDAEFNLLWDEGQVAIIPGAGNDTVSLQMPGWSGTTNYVLNAGDGSDVLLSDLDVYLLFDASVSPQSLRFGAEERNLNAGTNYPPSLVAGLAIHYGEQDDVVFVVGAHTNNQIQGIAFSGGSTYELLDYQHLRYVAGVQTPTALGGGESGWQGSEGDDFHASSAAVGGRPSFSMDDRVHGLGGNDTLDGDLGNDVLDGGSGDDVLIGGLGDDVLRGGEGDDTYQVGAGTGVDLVSDAGGGLDRVLFSAGVMPGDVEVLRQGSNLMLSVTGSTDAVILQGWFGDGTAIVEHVEFDDGTVWDASELASRAAQAAVGSPQQYGDSGDDILVGQTGNDLLSGDAGNDSLQGGQGDDVLLGGAGNDTYLFDVGDGVDRIYDDATTGLNTLRFGAGIAESDLSLGLGSLVIRRGPDAIHFSGFDPQDAINTVSIDRFEFADSTVLSAAQLLERGFDFDGTEGDDILSGTSVSDRFYGYGGNDWMAGGAGDDSYEIDPIAGDVVIEDVDTIPGNLDSILIGDSAAPANVDAERVGLDLRLDLDGIGNVTVKDWYLDAAHKVEEVYFFSDDTIWDVAALQAMTNLAPTGTVTVQGSPTQGQTLQADTATLADNDGLGTFSYQWLRNGSAIAGAMAASYALVPADGSAQVSVRVEYTDGVGNAESLSSAGVSVAPSGQIINGTSGANTLAGGSGNDVITGGLGSDTMYGGAGDDTFLIDGTDSGYDRFQGDAGYDVVLGGAGDDTIRVSYFAGDATVEKIDGGLGRNVIAGTNANDTINLSGTELVNIARIEGGIGHDTVNGGAGDDTINGGTGSDNLSGGAGDDTFLIDGTDSGYDRFQGDAGFDQIRGGAGDDTIRVSYFTGDATVEKIDGGLGSNVIAGTNANDTINLSGTELVNIARIEGGIGHDTINGGAGNDTINGGTGSDNLSGGAGDDTFLIDGTDSGYDRFQGDAGYDVVLGGAGDDTIRVSSFTGDATVEKIDGGLGTNVIAGTNANDSINLSGTELLNIARIEGGIGHDTIIGGAGDDTIVGGTGTDNLTGGAGDDTFLIDGTDSGYDRFQGDAGFDVVLGGAGDDTIRVSYFAGDATVEKIDGGLGSNVIAGTNANDTINLSGTELVNIARIEGGIGHDTVVGGAGNDTINGGTGSDNLSGGAGDDTFLIDGTDSGYDRFQGDAGFDQIRGGAGDDTIRVSSFTGDATVEKIDGGLGSNVIAGTNANDSINLSGTELLNIARIEGGIGHDNVNGGAGDDTIVGGTGTDKLTGGIGADTFVYGGVLDMGDTITDFAPGQDRLDITALLLSVGYLGNNPVGDGYLQAVVGAGSTRVMFDSDGSAGGGVASLLVQLTGVFTSSAQQLLEPGVAV